VRGICSYCGNPVRDTQRAAWRVTGWEVERAAGGANKILGRERARDRIWHDYCAERDAKVGEQQDLFGDSRGLPA
jgi:hypothetical protein